MEIGKFVRAAVLVLFTFFNISASASELTSGDHGEGYILYEAGTMCYAPVPVDDGDGDPTTFGYVAEPLMWLDYGLPVILHAKPPEQYFEWLYIVVDGTACLVEQGSAQSGPSPLYVADVGGNETPELPPIAEEPVVVEPPIATDPVVPDPDWQEPAPEVPEPVIVSEGQAPLNPTPAATTHTPGNPITGLPIVGVGTGYRIGKVEQNESFYGGPEDSGEWITLFGVVMGALVAGAAALALLFCSLSGYMERRDEINPKVKQVAGSIYFWGYLCPVGYIIIMADNRRKRKEQRRVATT